MQSTTAPVLLRGLAVSGCDAAALWFCRPDRSRLLQLIHSPGATLARLGADAVVALVAASVLWLIAGWVALALLTVCGGRLPGWSGRVCRTVAGIAVPVKVQRLLLGAVGVGVGVGLVAGPAMSAATAAPVAHRPAPVPCVSAVTVRPPGHAPLPVADAHATLPAPPWPGSPGHHPSSAHDGTAHRVRIQPGDSLWLIAARRLGPDATPARTTAYWPRVYAANRAVIGPDPDLVSPGQVLDLPRPGS